MRELASDLSTGMLAAPTEPTRVQRTTSEIIAALRQAGFDHPYGRPVSPEEVASPAEIVTATRSRLDANHDRQSRHVDDAQILAVARRIYLDVEAWPFSALS